MNMELITRLAPSPTGALHLGNARTFLVNWLMARQRGWRILLRIEDIDGPRIRSNADRQAMEDLRWIGIDWDGQVIYQSHRLSYYRDALNRLICQGAAYPCICTRSEIERAASAPHAEDGSSLYPGTCRGRFASVEEAQRVAGRAPAIRFMVGDAKVDIDDQFAGTRQFDVAKQLGDFVIAKADGTPAYQLAVVVDDAAAGVSEVVRGNDLLDSTPRQIMLYRSLGLQSLIPRYWHLPLVRGADGRRLAKRHGDTRLSNYREAGVSAHRVLELLARWCGIEGACPQEAASLVPRFDIARLPREDITYTADDERFLRS